MSIVIYYVAGSLILGGIVVLDLVLFDWGFYWGASYGVTFYQFHWFGSGLGVLPNSRKETEKIRSTRKG